jgi:hypothetical protein
MPEIKRVELERENDDGVHEVSKGERLDPVDPAPPELLPAEQSQRRREKDRGAQHDGDELERGTTPFPGG